MLKQTMIGALALAFGGVFACATPGSKPHEMSAEEHEAMSRAEQEKAQAHAAQYDPTLVQSEQECRTQAGKASTSRVCWTSLSNPTSKHREEAQKYLKMAADHRAGAQALRDAEAKACVGVSELDRDLSPFAHAEDIRSVESIDRPAQKGGTATPTGARISFAAVPGLSAEGLRRIVDCHVARNAVLGHDDPAMSACPLSVKGITTQVQATSAGYAVEVRSDDPKVAKEIVDRAKALTSQ